MYKKAHERIPIEIKTSKTFTQHFLKEINYFSQTFPEQCCQGYIVYAGEQEQYLGWRRLIHYLHVGNIMK